MFHIIVTPILMLQILSLDIDECNTTVFAIRLNNCEHLCFNTPGSYYCTCTTGYQLSDDKGSCIIKTDGISQTILIGAITGGVVGLVLLFLAIGFVYSQRYVLHIKCVTQSNIKIFLFLQQKEKTG